MNPKRLLSTRLVSGCVQRKKYFNDKMECPNRSLGKAGECMVLRAFETHLGAPSTTWSAFTVCHGGQTRDLLRSLPTFMTVLILWTHLSLRSPDLEVIFLLTAKDECICKRMLDGSVGTMRALSGVSILGRAISAHECVQAQTQGSDQRLPSSLEALQDCSVHRVDGLQ